VPVALGDPGRPLVEARDKWRPLMSGGFEVYPAWKVGATGWSGLSGAHLGAQPVMTASVPRDKESVMGAVKKARHEARAVKGKTKKGAGKVKSKAKKGKRAAKH
jgi:hypothetical protein